MHRASCLHLLIAAIGAWTTPHLEDAIAALRAEGQEIPDDYIAHLCARGDSFLPLYVRHDDGRGRPGLRGERWRLSPHSVWAVVKKYAALAGVDATTHHLRHLKARVLLHRGAQLAEVQDILGHASPETTKKIYAQYTTHHLRDAFDRYSLPAEAVADRAAAGSG